MFIPSAAGVACRHPYGHPPPFGSPGRRLPGKFLIAGGQCERLSGFVDLTRPCGGRNGGNGSQQRRGRAFGGGAPSAGMMPERRSKGRRVHTVAERTDRIVIAIHAIWHGRGNLIALAIVSTRSQALAAERCACSRLTNGSFANGRSGYCRSNFACLSRHGVGA